MKTTPFITNNHQRVEIAFTIFKQLNFLYEKINKLSFTLCNLLFTSEKNHFRWSEYRPDAQNHTEIISNYLNLYLSVIVVSKLKSIIKSYLTVILYKSLIFQLFFQTIQNCCKRKVFFSWCISKLHFGQKVFVELNCRKNDSFTSCKWGL